MLCQILIFPLLHNFKIQFYVAFQISIKAFLCFNLWIMKLKCIFTKVYLWVCTLCQWYLKESVEIDDNNICSGNILSYIVSDVTQCLIWTHMFRDFGFDLVIYWTSFLLRLVMQGVGKCSHFSVIKNVEIYLNNRLSYQNCFYHAEILDDRALNK